MLQKRLCVDLRMKCANEDNWYYIDFSFVNIASASSVKKASDSVVRQREVMKLDKYKEFFSTEQMKYVVPFVMDSAGNVGQLASNFLDKLSKDCVSQFEVSVKNEVLAALQTCYWKNFYQIKEVFHQSFHNPSVRQRNSHDSR